MEKCLEEFKSLIYSLNILNKEEYINELLSFDSVSKMNGQNYIGLKNEKEFLSFIKYVYSKIEEYGNDYILDALKYAKTFKNDNTSFIDQFIKFIVITNFDEIKIEFKEINGTISEGAFLGGLEISHNRNIEYNKEENRIECEWFHNRPGLKRTKVGTIMIVNFFDYVLHNYPGASVFSDNVKRSNVDAQTFYKKMGFDIIDINPEDKNICVIINPNKMELCIDENQGEYPVLIFDGKEYSYKTYKNNNPKKN